MNNLHHKYNTHKGFSCFSTALLFLLMLLLILFAKMIVFEFYRVTSESMENSLQVNDFLLIDKLSYGAKTPNKVTIPLIDITADIPSINLPKFRSIKNGDIVVFRENIDFSSHLMVKRCVALAGQTVEIKNKILFVDNQPIDSIFIQKAGQNVIIHKDSTIFSPDYIDQQVNPYGGNNRDNFGPLVVPNGSIFVLGDNRDLSLDSRYYGTINTENIIGRAVLVYFSCTTGIGSGWQNINWMRLGKFIN